jgi:transglutaminase-like putative cysteine protease
MIGRRRVVSPPVPGQAAVPVRDEAGLQPLDLLLSGASSVVAVYAAAASLASEKNALFFMWIVVAGTLSSALLLAAFGKSKMIFADTTAYFLIAIIALFGITGLNDMVPESIYTGPLSAAGVLSWMLALGSFTVWRDQTMLFQAVPAIALFGLVGCYDTFRASVLYFFVFLVCQAILLARVHGRVMLRQARSSGIEALEMSVMRKGPWRWMAGPEWALGSALTIVLISVISAPLLRESASGFSGLIHYVPPQSPLSQPALSSAAMSGTRVGTGPSVVRDIVVMRVDMPEPLYLRSFAFGRYDQGSWIPRSPTTANQDPNNGAPFDTSADAITDRREVTFRVEPVEMLGTAVPVPGEVDTLIGDSANVYFRNVGGSYSIRSEPPLPPLEGRSVLFAGKKPIKDADQNIGQYIPEYLQVDGIPGDVITFAMAAAKDGKTDYEKALAIKKAIEARCKYNLRAGATPVGEDPVSYFLFTSKEGYCDLFASAMTLMARSVGLPARYVTGYYPFKEVTDDAGRYVIRQKDLHAWCEIYFKDAGWVIFDATEGAISVDGGELGSTNDEGFWKSKWFTMLLTFGLGAGLLYGGFAAGSSYLKNRISADPGDLANTRAMKRLQSQVRKQYVSFERELRRAVRRPRGIGETTLEYVAAAQIALGSRSVLAVETGADFATALYAPQTLNPDTVVSLKAKVSGFKKARRSKPA